MVCANKKLNPYQQYQTYPYVGNVLKVLKKSQNLHTYITYDLPGWRIKFVKGVEASTLYLNVLLKFEPNCLYFLTMLHVIIKTSAGVNLFYAHQGQKVELKKTTKERK